MKKLLNILATTGLVATSTTTVIACGNKDKDEVPESIVDINQVIIDFKNEVSKLIEEQRVLTINNMSEHTVNTKGFKFLEKDFLEKNYKNQSAIKEEHKPLIIEDLKKTLEIEKVDGLSDKINKLATKDEYNAILGNLNGSIFAGIDPQNFISYSSSEGQEGIMFYAASIQFEYEIEVRYERSSGNVETTQFKSPFEFELSDNKEFLDATKEMRDNVKKDFVIEKKFTYLSNVYFDEVKENKEKNPLEDFTDEIKTRYYKEDNDLANAFDECAKSYFTKVPNLPGIKNISFSKKIEDQKIDWDIEYRKNTWTVEAEKLSDFQDLTEASKPQPLTDIAKTLDLIYKYDMQNPTEIAKNEVKNFLENIEGDANSEEKFIKQIDDFYKSNGITPNDKPTISKHTITRLGTIDIPKIEISFKSSKYIHRPPGNIKLIIGYSPEKWDRDKLTNHFINNITKAIGEFQKIYHIIPDKRKYPLGTMDLNSELTKLWLEEGLLNKIDLNSETAYPLINLDPNNPKLNEVRLKMLEFSKQTHFDYSFVGKGKKSFAMTGRSFSGDTFQIKWKRNLRINDNIFSYWFEIDYFKIKINYDSVVNQPDDLWYLMGGKL